MTAGKAFCADLDNLPQIIFMFSEHIYFPQGKALKRFHLQSGPIRPAMLGLELFAQNPAIGSITYHSLTAQHVAEYIL